MSFRSTGYTELLGYRRSVSNNSSGDVCVTWRCGCEVRTSPSRPGMHYDPCRTHERRRVPRGPRPDDAGGGFQRGSA